MHLSFHFVYLRFASSCNVNDANLSLLTFFVFLFSLLAHCINSFKSTESYYCVVLVDLSSSSLPSLNVQFTDSSSQPLLFNNLNSGIFVKLTILRHSVKLCSFNFHESNTPYYFLPPKLNFSSSCISLLFPNFSSVSMWRHSVQPWTYVSKQSQFTSPLDVYEPFSSSTLPKLRIATLNARSVCNKSAVISDHILSDKLDIICLAGTWINYGELSNLFASSFFPPNYLLSQCYGRPRSMHDSSLAIISHKSTHHTSISVPI